MITITSSGSSLSEVLSGMTSVIEVIRGARQAAKPQEMNSPKEQEKPVKSKHRCPYDQIPVAFETGEQTTPFHSVFESIIAETPEEIGKRWAKESIKKLAKGPNSIPSPSRHPIIPDTGQYWADEAHKKLQAYIRDCLRHNLDFSDILFSLKQLKGVSMSPAELGSIIQEMAEAQDAIE